MNMIIMWINNWYTNHQFKWCLEYAAENISKLEKECIESVNRNNVTEEEVKTVKYIS